VLVARLVYRINSKVKIIEGVNYIRRAQNKYKKSASAKSSSRHMVPCWRPKHPWGYPPK